MNQKKHGGANRNQGRKKGEPQIKRTFGIFESNLSWLDENIKNKSRFINDLIKERSEIK